MNLSNLSPAARFAIALSASMGVGHIAFQAFTRNLGPIPGLVLGMATITLFAVGLYVVLERIVDKTNKQEPSDRMSAERMNFESLDRR